MHISNTNTRHFNMNPFTRLLPINFKTISFIQRTNNTASRCSSDIYAISCTCRSSCCCPTSATCIIIRYIILMHISNTNTRYFHMNPLTRLCSINFKTSTFINRSNNFSSRCSSNIYTFTCTYSSSRRLP